MSQPGGLSSNPTGTSMLLKIACGLKDDRKKQYQEQKLVRRMGQDRQSRFSVIQRKDTQES
jgi:hypothetical protein